MSSKDKAATATKDASKTKQDASKVGSKQEAKKNALPDKMKLTIVDGTFLKDLDGGGFLSGKMDPFV